MALTPGGYRRLPGLGNAGQRLSWSSRRLPPGRTYYWSVQAIDGAFAGSPFAVEGSFTLPHFGEISNSWAATHQRRAGRVGRLCDNDGDLDIALSGRPYNSAGPSYITRIYRNDDDHFSDIGADLSDGHSAVGAWGDYDNDGDLDLLLGAVAGDFDDGDLSQRQWRLPRHRCGPAADG